MKRISVIPFEILSLLFTLSILGVATCADEPNEAKDSAPLIFSRQTPLPPRKNNYSRLDLSNRDFEYGSVYCTNVDYSGSNLSHVDISGCQFVNCSFKDADLSYVQGCCPSHFREYDDPYQECYNAAFKNCDFENALITGAQDLTITYQDLIKTRRDENGKLMLQNCKLDVRGARDSVFGDVVSFATTDRAQDYKERNRAWLDLSGCDLTGCQLSWGMTIGAVLSPHSFHTYLHRFPGSPFNYPPLSGSNYLSLMNKVNLKDAIIRNTGSTFTREDVPAETLMQTKDFKERKLVNLLWKPDSKPYDPYDYISFYSHSKPRKLKYDFTDFILINCTFINCDLTDVVFDNCCFINCTFVDCMPHSSKSPTMNVKLGNYDPIEIIDLKTYLTRPYLEDKDHAWVVKPMRGLGSPLIDAAAELREEKR